MSEDRRHTFVSELSEHLFSQYGHDISSLTVLLPSQRAQTFFIDAFKGVTNATFWAPQFTTVEKLMCEISTLHVADKIRLLTELYTIYNKHHNETFDQFYQWGELLLADFDMIDKYKVDAVQIFQNIHDIKELESNIDYLTPRQLEIIRKFWSTIYGDDSPSEQRKKFLNTWLSLNDIYNEFRNHLRSIGIGYTGMIYRDAAEKITSSSGAVLKHSQFIVAGFNALSTCEQILFKYLKNFHNAQFFWDYDDYYANSEVQESGRFIRQNIKDFAPINNPSHNNFRNIEAVNIVATNTAVSQCKYAVDILKQIAVDKDGNRRPLDKETAIVLTDENLLLPLLYALPADIGKINVTMGYPFRATAAASLIERLLALQTHSHSKDGCDTFYHVDIERVMTHPYISKLFARSIHKNISKNIIDNHRYHVTQSSIIEWGNTTHLKSIFSIKAQSGDLLAYLIEVFEIIAENASTLEESQRPFIITAIEEITKLKNTIDACSVDIPKVICHKLLRKHLQTIRIPYTGEPLEGIQIMGILETRNLDFKNVLILSTSDANFPGKRTADASFIPYNLRYAHGLPTPEHHDSVYAYYFYRLIQRASQVWTLYSTHGEDGSGASEPSRYIRQLIFESGLNITQTNVSAEIIPAKNQAITIEKDDRVMERIMAYTDGRKKLSPSTFSSYVECPMKFYFSAIADIRKEDELSDNIDYSDFGNIFHKAAELLYTPLIKAANIKERLTEKLEDGTLDKIAQQALLDCGFTLNKEGEFEGEMSIINKIVKNYLEHVVKHDIRHSSFTVNELEKNIYCKLPICCNGSKIEVSLKGRSDRIDILDDGTFRIIDYKSGKPHLVIPSIKTLFNGSFEQRQRSSINTIFYAMVHHLANGSKVQPALYFVRAMVDEEYCELLSVNKEKLEQYDTIRSEFESEVIAQLETLFDKSVPFVQVEDRRTCSFCDFKSICMR